MLQALREIREPERSRLWTAVFDLLVLSCALAIPGCASTGLSTAFLSPSDSQGLRPSAIRSQSSSDSDGQNQNSATSVTADYSPVTAVARMTDASPAHRTTVESAVPKFTGGHSFVQRRARLGTPVMLPANSDNGAPVIVGRPSTDSVSGSLRPFTSETVNAVGASPLAGHHFDPGSGTNSTETSEEASPIRDLDLGGAGWQKFPDEHVSQQSSEEQSGRSGERLSRSDGWENGSPETQNTKRRTITDLSTDPQGTELEVNQPSEGSAEGSGDVIPEEKPFDGSSDAGSDEVSPKEPGMLERLRGLYIPRREDSVSDRSRKQARRWTDPFGLLRERDTETVDAAVGSSSPLSGAVESGIQDVENRETQAAAAESQDLLKPLIEQMERELSELPTLPNGKPLNEAEWRRRQTDLRMLYLVAGRAAESIRVIEALPEKEQEFWQAMMLAMDAYRRNDDSTSRTIQLTETLDYVRSASRQLRPLSILKIRRLNFCNRIDGFGMFSVFPTAEFNAGQPLLLYAEIENYMSELSPEGQYRSEFAALIEFHREGDTEPIVSRTIRLPEIEDLCATERTDYYQSYELTVPSLSPGRYTLRLRVRDQLSLQTAVTELAFEIRPLGSHRTE